MISVNNAVWMDWFKHTEEIREEAAGMDKKELIEKILSYEDIQTEKQKKVYLKKLKWKKIPELIDLWIEKEYIKTHT